MSKINYDRDILKIIDDNKRKRKKSQRLEPSSKTTNKFRKTYLIGHDFEHFGDFENGVLLSFLLALDHARRHGDLTGILRVAESQRSPEHRKVILRISSALLPSHDVKVRGRSAKFEKIDKMSWDLERMKLLFSAIEWRLTPYEKRKLRRAVNIQDYK